MARHRRLSALLLPFLRTHLRPSARSLFEKPTLVREIITRQDQPAWDQFLEDANTEKGYFLDFRIRTKEGDIRWLNVVGRSVFGIGMKPLGLRCSFRDITERKKMEQQLRHQALHDP